MKCKILLLISAIFYQMVRAQPHLHIQKDQEAIRIDGNLSWLSFWRGGLYDGFLWNNQGNMTLGTSDENSFGSINFITNHNARMTINHLGRIGINTDNPLALTHIQGDNEVLRLSGAQPYLSLYNGLGSYAGYLWNKNLFDLELGTSSTNSTGSLFLRTRGNLGLWIDPDGLVGIRKSPTEALDVSGKIRTDAGLIFTIPGTLNEIFQVFYTNQYIGLAFAYNNSIGSVIKINGDYVIPSDRNLKSNIREYPSGVLPKIKNLRAYQYEYLKTPGESNFGLIAQEVQSVFPEIVHTLLDNDEDVLGIAYNKLSVIAIKAIQEQQTIIENQQEEINDLKKKLNNLLEIVLAR